MAASTITLRWARFVVLASIFGAGLVLAQTTTPPTKARPATLPLAPDGHIMPDRPSNENIFNAVDFVDRKTDQWEGSMRVIERKLNEITPGYGTQSLGMVTIVRKFVEMIRKTGPNAYRLVGLEVSLDDLAYRGQSAVVVNMTEPSKVAEGELIAMMAADQAIVDAATMLNHVTLQLIEWEEDMLDKVNHILDAIPDAPNGVKR